MRTNYRANSGVQFRMFSDDQLEELFNGALHVLENIGLEVKHEQAREILKEAGAWVDGDLVRLPSYMVKDALAKAPAASPSTPGTAIRSTTFTSVPDELTLDLDQPASTSLI